MTIPYSHWMKSLRVTTAGSSFLFDNMLHPVCRPLRARCAARSILPQCPWLRVRAPPEHISLVRHACLRCVPTATVSRARLPGHGFQGTASRARPPGHSFQGTPFRVTPSRHGRSRADPPDLVLAFMSDQFCAGRCCLPLGIEDGRVWGWSFRDENFTAQAGPARACAAKRK